MVDLGPALESFHRRRSQRTGEQLIGYVPSAHDVLERAAFLEFCEGLDRAAADKQALTEFGFESWDSLHESSACLDGIGLRLSIGAEL